MWRLRSGKVVFNITKNIQSKPLTTTILGSINYSQWVVFLKSHIRIVHCKVWGVCMCEVGHEKYYSSLNRGCIVLSSDLWNWQLCFLFFLHLHVNAVMSTAPVCWAHYHYEEKMMRSFNCICNYDYLVKTFFFLFVFFTAVMWPVICRTFAQQQLITLT